MTFLVIAPATEGHGCRAMPGGYCRNNGTRGSPDVVKVGPPHVGPPRRRSRPRHKTSRWAPHLSRDDQANTASTTTTTDRGTPWGTLNPAEDMVVPGTPTPGRRPGSPPGTNLHTREEDKFASPGWKPPKNLGAKKMEAPWRTGTEKLAVSVRPHGKGGRPHLTPVRRILGREEATSPPKKSREGFSRQNPSCPKCAPVVSS